MRKIAGADVQVVGNGKLGYEAAIAALKSGNPFDVVLTDMTTPESTCRERIEVRGVVQGVGFRPFVHSLASRLGLSGFVRNHARGITIEIEGTDQQRRIFIRQLTTDSPVPARIDQLESTPVAIAGAAGFRILESEARAEASTLVSPDLATCDACLQELGDPANRRYRYPFINCAQCGPRYTILSDLPYDRPSTTMSHFTMCDSCRREYDDPSDRRFHAQPNACPACGPQVWFVTGDSNSLPAVDTCSDIAREDAIAAFHRSIDNDEIVAVKGIGGFHLACAADSATAIEKLRRRKGRVDKPLAVMVCDLQTAAQHAWVSEYEAKLLESSPRPIVLLQRRPGSSLSPLVAPGSELLGIMLPYSPLHWLLAQSRPLVMTSGNRSEEPIVRSNREADGELRQLCDAFLFHDRKIHVVCDDSVTRVVHDRQLPIRRSRGFAPLPVALRRSLPDLLAVGGELKNTFCVTKHDYAYLSPHIGDMGSDKTGVALSRAVDHFENLFRVQPQAVVCDLHPDYLTHRWARENASARGVPLLTVQHHHAHIASVLAEHCLPEDKPVIGLSFDGTGYGTDGAIWGSEVLIASCSEFRRFGHLRYVPLPGGDTSIKHPYRSALAHLWAANLQWDQRLPCLNHLGGWQLKVLRRQLETGINCVPTSSMGRLFDAVAALVGIRQSVSFEAQAAMEMEGLCDSIADADPYRWTALSEAPIVIDPAPILAATAGDYLAQVPRFQIISRFYMTVVEMIIQWCQVARRTEQIDDVVLSGGVFQNKVLTERAVESLESLGFHVWTNQSVPPNDGGLSLGQAVVAAAQMVRGKQHVSGSRRSLRRS